MSEAGSKGIDESRHLFSVSRWAFVAAPLLLLAGGTYADPAGPAALAQRSANSLEEALRENPQAEAIARGIARGKIVGGEVVQISDNPWQVALVRGLIAEPTRSQFCGGSVIAADWVLTAAHCVRNSMVREDPARINVVAGTSQFVFGGERVRVAAIHVHPRYNTTTQDSDFALLQLSRPLTLGGAAVTQRVDTLGPRTPIPDGLMVRATGWGATVEGAPGSLDLLGATMPTVSNTICNRPESYNGEITDTMMCAGRQAGGLDSCQGDSGGPLTANLQGHPVLVGVVSWGEGCARRAKYGIYARVSAASDWISQTMNE